MSIKSLQGRRNSVNNKTQPLSLKARRVELYRYKRALNQCKADNEIEVSDVMNPAIHNWRVNMQMKIGLMLLQFKKKLK